MSPAAAAVARRPASPYARKLARERAVALELVAGTGPDGRIVAADIEAFAAGRRLGSAAQPVASDIAASAAASAFSIAVDMAAASALLPDLDRAGAPVSIETLLVRAAALALEAVPAARPHGTVLGVALERGSGSERRLVAVADPHLGRIGALHETLAAAAGQPGQAGSAEPDMSVRCLIIAGVRAFSMPLLPGVPLRLVLSTAPDKAAAEALLSFDAALIGEDTAATLLGRIRDGLEKPLRLLA
jgi:pyruvate dehydrogenase E2 component (dihydrolipoamide acetyltransferase)